MFIQNPEKWTNYEEVLMKMVDSKKINYRWDNPQKNNSRYNEGSQTLRYHRSFKKTTNLFEQLEEKHR